MSAAKRIPLVTLLTDFGDRDGFVGVMKGVMLSIAPEMKIVDLAHDIPPHDVQSAAFVIAQSYAFFPEGTLHVIVVDPGVGSERRILYVEAGEYAFLAPDNGVLRFVASRERIRRIISVENRKYFRPELSYTFHGRDIFAPVAAHLARGIPPEELGTPATGVRFDPLPEPRVAGDSVIGEIVYIDRFGNLISNIDGTELQRLLTGYRRFVLKIAGRTVDRISRSYFDSQPGELLAYIDSSGYLAFALNGENASEKMGISLGDRFEMERRKE
jgi:hypothetical protein